METLLATLLSIAISAALDSTVSSIERNQAKGQEVSSDDILRVTSAMLNEAQAKGDETLRKVTERLANITLPYGSSSALKSYITKVRRDAKNKVEKTQKAVNELNKKADALSQRAHTLAYQPESYRMNAGKGEYENIKREASDLMKSFNEVEENV